MCDLLGCDTKDNLRVRSEIRCKHESVTSVEDYKLALSHLEL